MFFSSIKEINVFSNIKNKRISNIYLKVTIEKEGLSEDLNVLNVKKLSPGHFLGQLTHILLNFRTSCSNLKIRGLGAKVYVAFLLF